MLKVCELIKQAAPTQATVLVRGESGTGKEIVAHAIHQLSSRSKGPFIAVHCAALSQTLMESELFGHEKGAFTGANERRVGRFEQADGGTLFMDEVSEIPPSAQTKLLRVLEERCFERVGGSKTVEVDIRLISATNKNLKSLTDSGAFRSDLYFRMNVVDIDLPPLREHMEDLPLLCRHFLDELARENNKNIEDVSPEVLNVFSSYSWPGNVRELRNAIERMIVFSRGSKLTARDIPPEIRKAAGKEDEAGRWPEKGAAPVSMEQAEKMMIVRALEQNDDNRTRAAKQLGISRRTFHRKLKQFHLEDMK
jgi:two-component system response regulator HydG